MFPDSFDFAFSVYQRTFAVLLVVQELSDVDPTIFELLLAMLLNDTIIKASYHLGAVLESVAAVAREGALLELTLVVVPVPVLSHSVPLHKSKFKGALETALGVLEVSFSVELPPFEVALVEVGHLVRSHLPNEPAFAVIIAIFEFAFVRVTIRPEKSAEAVKLVRKETASVDSFLLWLREEDQFALSRHLRVGKLTDIVAAIRPPELAMALYVALFQAPSEDVSQLSLHTLQDHRLSPLLDALSVDLMLVEVPAYFNSCLQHLQTARALHLRSRPVTFVFSVQLSFRKPLELALPLELAVCEAAVVV